MDEITRNVVESQCKDWLYPIYTAEEKEQFKLTDEQYAYHQKAHTDRLEKIHEALETLVGECEHPLSVVQVVAAWVKGQMLDEQKRDHDEDEHYRDKAYDAFIELADKIDQLLQDAPAAAVEYEGWCQGI
jgi:dsDNA-binding SOS-regulon protein